ncbi:MAG: flagellar basal body P-ring protein FlgI [Chromatiales bacterium]|nr:flagellar basal body P-ring protein FlgI [Chromatiales bacterium]
MSADGVIRVLLNQPDYTTASRIAAGINEQMNANIAIARDAGRVEIALPESERPRVVDFVARVENIAVQPDQRARVVINERTGTVVSGGDVRLSKVSVAHGDLRVSIVTDYLVPQPTGWMWRTAPGGAYRGGAEHAYRCAGGNCRQCVASGWRHGGRARGHVESDQDQHARHHYDPAEHQARRRLARGAGDSMTGIESIAAAMPGAGVELQGASAETVRREFDALILRMLARGGRAAVDGGGRGGVGVVGDGRNADANAGQRAGRPDGSRPGAAAAGEREVTHRGEGNGYR